MTEHIALAPKTARKAARNPWLGVELRHLAALAAVAREGSFRGAADSLGYVQSAVSQQVAQLERVVGHRLVERERGSTHVGITTAGELLLEHSDRLLAGLSAARADLEEVAEGAAGRLRIGACSTLGPGVLARVLPGLVQKTPHLHVDTIEGPAEELAAQISAGALDAAFAELPISSTGPFVATPLCSNRHLLLAHPDSPPARAGRAPDAAELSELPLLGHPLMNAIEPRLTGVGVRPRYTVSCGSVLSLRRLVTAGVGCAIVPSLLWDEHDDVVAIPLDDLLPRRSVGVFVNSERVAAPATRMLIDHAAHVYNPLACRPQGTAAPWLHRETGSLKVAV